MDGLYQYIIIMDKIRIDEVWKVLQGAESTDSNEIKGLWMNEVIFVLVQKIKELEKKVLEMYG